MLLLPPLFLLVHHSQSLIGHSGLQWITESKQWQSKPAPGISLCHGFLFMQFWVATSGSGDDLQKWYQVQVSISSFSRQSAGRSSAVDLCALWPGKDEGVILPYLCFFRSDSVSAVSLHALVLPCLKSETINFIISKNSRLLILKRAALGRFAQSLWHISQTLMGSYRIWSRITENTSWMTLLPRPQPLYLGALGARDFCLFICACVCL